MANGSRICPMIGTYQYGEPRTDAALRIGVARQPPRGVRREDWRRKNHFDLWLRILSPSSALVRRYRGKQITFREFEIGYRAEMGRPEPRQVIELLALFSRRQSIRLGCFCECEGLCHRPVLKALIESADANLPMDRSSGRRRNASPVCFLEEED